MIMMYGHAVSRFRGFEPVFNGVLLLRFTRFGLRAYQNSLKLVRTEIRTQHNSIESLRIHQNLSELIISR